MASNRATPTYHVVTRGIGGSVVAIYPGIDPAIDAAFDHAKRVAGDNASFERLEVGGAYRGDSGVACVIPHYEPVTAAERRYFPAEWR